MRILVVEDDLDIRDFLKMSLEEQCFSVDTTADGERGLHCAKSYAYDAILLDHVLPKKDGLKVCKEIRGAGITTPIIILTVQSSLRLKVDFLNAGADDYITKPFSLEELLARLRAVLRRSPKVSKSLLTIADLSLDRNKQKVIRGKKEIYLTRKEFSLLEYLMEHSDTVVSRGMILEHVWNKDGDPFSNTVEAHVLNLRKKIEWGKKKRLIHNLPGRGYKISIKK